MARPPSPRAVALVDQIVAALRDSPGTTDEIAERVGTVACKCLVNARTGYRRSGLPCACADRTGVPGWRRACGFDVYRHLVRLEHGQLVLGRRDPARRQVSWSLAPIDVSAVA
jgi:hypothetical protein